MIIDIINIIILIKMTEGCNTIYDVITDQPSQMKNLSSKSTITKYALDFKQSIAFETMTSSFILKSLQIENVTYDVLHNFPRELPDKNEEDKIRY